MALDRWQRLEFCGDTDFRERVRNLALTPERKQQIGFTPVSARRSRLRVALVLDNTGSMADNGKMDAMKTAAKNFLDPAQEAATSNGDVYVSIIPFSKDVNIGASNYTQTYIRWDLWDAANGSCSGFSGSICYNGTLWTVSGTGFVNGGSCSSPTSGICYNGTLYNWNGSTFTPTEAAPTTDLERLRHRSRPGLRHDQYGALDRDTAPTVPGRAVSRLPGPAHAAELRLDCAQRQDRRDDAGRQHQPDDRSAMGLPVADRGALHIPAKDPNYTYNQVVILLTDGLNTQNRFSTTQSSIDARTKKACDNIKAAGITLYALQVNTGGDPTSTCCSSARPIPPSSSW